ncbi:hypothetical protein E3N88_38796 [Mikania micrantha]|uniref:Uncharacterized protein n=1 Tax=Mikania micrantha TaxID=192012 RepID=A0A5N6LV08_9ASTR|nr:hypothetical protein E3N88_38796 [Mikania micrantha]
MVFTRTWLDESSQLPAYESVPEGSASAGTKRTLATHFATECGIVIRNVSPMKFHTWDAKEVKTLVYEKLEESFEWLWADNVLMEYVDA